jgi:polyisoprenoid-binding protein YceI
MEVGRCVEPLASRECDRYAIGVSVVYGPAEATCEVLVFREGLLSAVGHDLLLRATALEVAVDRDAPALTARVDARSLRVVGAMRDGRPLPGGLRPEDVRDIERTIVTEVLRAARFPEIRFASTGVRAAEGGYQVQGTLALAGATRPLVLPVRRAEGRLATEVTLRQPEFGIRPYRAMLGALRVKPEVVVRASVPVD